MKRNAALLALSLLPAMAQARCVEVAYSFEGQVLDKSGKPAAGALVGASWLEFGQAAGPAMAVADREGRYRLIVRYRPGDDMPLVGDGCTDRLARISVVAHAGNQRSYPAEIRVSALHQKLPNIRTDGAPIGP